MTEETRLLPTGPLVATKLNPPSRVAGYGERARLGGLLDRTLSDATRLTLLSAPPGYGKTVALAGWLGSRGLAHAWLVRDQAGQPGRRTPAPSRGLTLG